MELYLADVGDGLCMAIAASDKVLQIDCGSQDGGRGPIRAPCVSVAAWVLRIASCLLTSTRITATAWSMLLRHPRPRQHHGAQ